MFIRTGDVLSFCSSKFFLQNTITVNSGLEETQGKQSSSSAIFQLAKSQFLSFGIFGKFFLFEWNNWSGSLKNASSLVGSWQVSHKLINNLQEHYCQEQNLNNKFKPGRTHHLHIPLGDKECRRLMYLLPFSIFRETLFSKGFIREIWLLVVWKHPGLAFTPV